MQNWFTNILRSNSEIEENSPRNLQMLRSILLFMIGATILTAIFMITQRNLPVTLIVGVLSTLLFVSYVLLQRGLVFPARLFPPLALLIAVSLISIRADGIHDSAIVMFGLAIVFASLTMGQKGTLLFTGLTFIIVLTIGILEISGVLKSRFSEYTDPTDIIVIGLIAPIVIASVQILLINRLNQSLALSKENEEEQEKINAELSQLQQNLEERIVERTFELEKKSEELEEQLKANQRRANQFQAVADVARYVANIQNLDALFSNITDLISERFGYYHVGVFLNDEADFYAILRASNSAGGQQMLENNHRLKIGETGIVGNVAQTGSPRVALDTGDDAVFFNNPYLPETHSEMAVALKIADKIIGVIDIQSIETNAFSNEDTDVFTALADQIAIAIENTRLYENTQKSIAESETIYRQYLGSEWKRFSSEEMLAGYHYKLGSVEPFATPIESPDFTQALETGNVSIHSDEKDLSSLVVPIKLRGEILGVLNIKQPGNRNWAKDEIELVQSVADRVAISAENARLFEDSQQRASQEQAIGEISAKLSSSVNLNTVLQTAVEELGRVLYGSEVAIQLIKDGEDKGQ